VRRAARTDANLTEIVNALRSMGVSVHVTNGAWDITLGFGGIVFLAEIKDGSKPPSARKYTKAQLEFRNTFTGAVRLITNLDDVRETVKTMRLWRERICRSARLGEGIRWRGVRYVRG